MNTIKRWFVGYFSFSHGRASGMRLVSRRIRHDKEGEYVIVDGGRIRLNDERLSGEVTGGREMNNIHFQHTPHLKCPECGHNLLFAGRGRHECTNPQCTIIYVTVNRVGKQYQIITQGPSMITEPIPSYAVKPEGLR